MTIISAPPVTATTFLVLCLIGACEPPQNYSNEPVYMEVAHPAPTTIKSEIQIIPVLSSFSTEFDPSATNRASNIILAANKLNWTTIPPFSVFSFNEVIGERVIENGYLSAPQFFAGTKIEGIGGGVCQVSSTLYVAAMMGGMKVTKRHSHSRPVSYIPMGMDAAVSSDGLDLVFENPYDAILTIRTIVNDNQLIISLVGLDAGLEVKRLYKRHIEIPYPVQEIKSKFISDKKLYQKGSIGIPGTSTWLYYRNGELINTVLAISNYAPVPEIWVVPERQ